MRGLHLSCRWGPMHWHSFFKRHSRCSKTVGLGNEGGIGRGRRSKHGGSEGGREAARETGREGGRKGGRCSKTVRAHGESTMRVHFDGETV